MLECNAHDMLNAHKYYYCCRCAMAYTANCVRSGRISLICSRTYCDVLHRSRACVCTVYRVKYIKSNGVVLLSCEHYYQITRHSNEQFRVSSSIPTHRHSLVHKEQPVHLARLPIQCCFTYHTNVKLRIKSNGISRIRCAITQWNRFRATSGRRVCMCVYEYESVSSSLQE